MNRNLVRTITLRELCTICNYNDYTAAKTILESFYSETRMGILTISALSKDDYSLNKEQSLRIGVKLNADAIMEIVEYWEGMESNSKQPFNYLEVLRELVTREEFLYVATLESQMQRKPICGKPETSEE